MVLLAMVVCHQDDSTSDHRNVSGGWRAVLLHVFEFGSLSVLVSETC